MNIRGFLALTVVGIGMLAGASRSEAIPFSDLDVVNLKLNAYSSQNTYSGTFNIVDDGFVPGQHHVWAAAITFCLADDSDIQRETFTINIDGDYGSSRYTSFLVLGITQVGIDLLASLNDDGILSYSVSATSGDFWLRSALLLAEARVQGPSPSDGHSVPDNGATIALLGLALSAVGVGYGRVKKK